MRYRLLAAWIVCSTIFSSHAQLPGSPRYLDTPAELTADGVPTIPVALADLTRPYLEYRTAIFRGWNVTDHSMLISTRFGNTAQIHQVKFPDADRTQLTFETDPIALASWDPKKSRCAGRAKGHERR